MTDEQKYNELLKEIGAMIREKNERIAYLEFVRCDLESKLKKAEAELEKAVANCAVEMMKIEEKKQG